MTLEMGYNTVFGYGEETEWGTLVTLTKFLELIAGGDGLDEDIDPIHSASMKRILWDKTRGFAQGVKRVRGPLSFEMPYEGAGRILKHGFGSVATTEPDPTNYPGSYQHIFTISESLPVGLSVCVRRGSQGFTVIGCKVAALEFKCAVGGFLTVTAELLGKSANFVSWTASPTLPSHKPFVFTEAEIGESWIGGTINIPEFTIRLGNNLDDGRLALGSQTIREPVRAAGKIEVTARFIMEFDETTTYSAFKAASQHSLTITFTSADTIPGAGGAVYQFILRLGAMRITKAVPKPNDEGRITYEVTCQGYWDDDGSTEPLKVTLFNGLSSI